MRTAENNMRHKTNNATKPNPTKANRHMTSGPVTLCLCGHWGKHVTVAGEGVGRCVGMVGTHNVARRTIFGFICIECSSRKMSGGKRGVYAMRTTNSSNNKDRQANKAVKLRSTELRSHLSFSLSFSLSRFSSHSLRSSHKPND